MKILCAGALMIWCASLLAQNTAPQNSPQETVKVKIEATELDRRVLLNKLNANGSGHKMKFESVDDDDYTYRIVFGTDQETALGGRWGSNSTYNTSSASTSVFDHRGFELFQFKRRLRITDGGSTNAVAKEIIKRLLKLRRE